MMNNKIKAIETSYNGYKFRSRLEARWAVFFDSLGIEWEYELEGYKLGDGTWYLPDFYLPYFHGGIYVEVKPDTFHDNKAHQFSIDSQKGILMAIGCPEYPKAYDVFWSGNAVKVAFDSKYLNKNYLNEYRFYFSYGDDLGQGDETIMNAVNAAKRAKFEWER